MAVIALENVEKEYQLGQTRVPALRGIDLEIGEGEMLCFMGSSGCGKSTLLNLIGGIDHPTAGRVVLCGEDLEKMDDYRLSAWRNRNLGFIFQNFNLVPVLNAFENVEHPLLLRKNGSADRRRKVERMLELVGMSEHMRHRPDQLSGGQRQRVAIARALVTEPQVVLADEPTASLDSATGAMILELMREFNWERRTTFIFSTHDHQVTGYARRIVRLKDGKVAHDGPANPEASP